MLFIIEYIWIFALESSCWQSAPSLESGWRPMRRLFPRRLIHSAGRQVQATGSCLWRIQFLCPNSVSHCWSNWLWLGLRRPLISRGRKAQIYEHWFSIRDLLILLCSLAWHLYCWPLLIRYSANLEGPFREYNIKLLLTITYFCNPGYSGLLDEVAPRWRLLWKQWRPLQNGPPHCPPMSRPEFGEAPLRTKS